MMEIEPAATSRLTPIGNIYRCTYRRTNSSNDVCRSDNKSKASESRLSGEIQRSLSLNPSPSRRKSPSRNDDVSTMTIEFLRARLLAERSTAKTAKRKIEELEDKVSQLERSLVLEIEKRKNAEAALQESLEKMLDSSSVSGRASTDSELEYRVAEHEHDDDDSKYSDSYLELEDTGDVLDPCTNAGQDRQSASNHDTVSHFAESHQYITVPAETRGDDEQEEDEEEGQRTEERTATGELSLPCAESLEPHNIHSDSDWATDNEAEARRSSSTAAARDVEFDSDSDGYSISLPSQLHLGQLELPGKIGRCLGSARKSRSGSEWVRHVVGMLEQEDPETADSPEACNRVGDDNTVREDSGEAPPYVSFAKYLGSNSLVPDVRAALKFAAAQDETASFVQPTDSNSGRDELGEQHASACSSVELGNAGAVSCTENTPSKRSGISLRDRVFNSEEERVDEIFRALRAAKAQLKSSIQRRQVIEKQLFTTTST